MKKLNSLFIILLCCVSAMSVTSCLGDDDDYGLDPETYRQYLTLMSGMYYGDSSKEEYKNKIYFFNDTITDKENENKQDAIGNISLAISAQDTTFAISNIPGKIFTKELPDEYKELREAINNAPNQVLRGKLDLNQENSGYVYFLTYPTSITYSSLNYGGKAHKVTLRFYHPSLTLGVYGSVDNSKQAVQFNIYLADIIIDDDVNNPINICKQATDTELRKALYLVSVTR